MHIGWILDPDRALRFVHSHGIYPTVSDERGITPNYYGACLEALAIPMKYIERLGEVVAPGVRPMWYLDMDQWTWTRRFSEKFIRKKHKSTQTEPDATSDTTGPTVGGKTKTKTKAKAKTKTNAETETKARIKQPPRPTPAINDTDVEPCS
ncbi:uncharacterized protein STEHIDRAFT_114623 [Stereum hirsutum FP-91666 SS1]|uniref:uncharacterized protein n=1 Tax=Stereum hirsutum (strain FP-91666) TaxID=721885 RepID=UPI0004449CE0|nr:uncharacterized protein STEHIDRAFT_114623 [Stereum hirsutum FP-91666 SS1]EIM81940.1 hypothetical protein STEHIDRAFT_114623 [Stereum hirsutum FP-91666 SS1]